MHDKELRSAERHPAELYVTLSGEVSRAGNTRAIEVPGRIADYSDGGVRVAVDPEQARELFHCERLRISAGAVAAHARPVLRKPRIRRPDDDVSCSIGLQFDSPAPELVRAAAKSLGRAKHRIIDYEIPKSRRAQVMRQLLRAYGHSQPLENILHRMIYAAGCNYVLANQTKQSGAVFDSFAHKEFRTSHRPVRIHFFRDFDHRGYVEVLPTRIVDSTTKMRLGHVGKSVVPYPEGDTTPESENTLRDGSTYFLLAARQRCVLLGFESHIDALKYEQQGVVIGSCGHAALAMSTGFLAQLLRTYHCAQNSMASIAGIDRYSDLSEREIVDILRKAGYAPRVYYSEDLINLSATVHGARPLAQSQLLDVAHVAIDSYIPPILCLSPRTDPGERHAVTVVGHTVFPRAEGARQQRTYKYSDVLDDSPTDHILSSTSWVQDFLVHDDAVGPYLRLPLSKAHKHPSLTVRDKDYQWAWDRSAISHVESVIIPFPDGVRLDPELVGGVASTILIQTMRKAEWGRGSKRGGASVLQQIHQSLLGNSSSSNRLVFNIYLDHGDRFRVSVCSVISAESIECEALGAVHLPRHVYIVSILTEAEVNERGPLDASILGYMILDATATANSANVMLFARIGEALWFLHPTMGEVSDLHSGYERRTHRRLLERRQIAG